MLPKSNIKKAFKEVQKMVESSSNLLNSCKSATGWADMSLPKFSSVESASSIAASRIPTRRQPNPEKVKSFTISIPPQESEVQEEPEEGSQAQSQSVKFTEKSCGMEDNQCPCGRLFLNRDDLNSHISAEHKPNHWNYSKCDKIYEIRGVLYKHLKTSTKDYFNITVNPVIMGMMTGHALLIICTKNMVVLKLKAL